MSFDFDTPIDRANSDSAKWAKYRGRDIIPMWVADMDFRSPPAVIEALRTRADHGVFGYTRTPKALVEEVLAMLAHQYAWEVKAEWILWLPAMVPALDTACRAVGEEGDEVMTAVPIYPPFLQAPGRARLSLVTTALQRRKDLWEFDFGRFENAITARTRLYMLCNPHNPVGRVYTRHELETIAEICARRDLIICSDEIHCELILDQHRSHLPTATLGPEIADRTITLMAPSKTYNLAGLGCSFAVIPNPDLRRRFKAAAAGIVPGVNMMAYAAAIAAYRHGRQWRLALLDYLRNNRDAVEQTVGELPGLSLAHIEATYLAWIDARGVEDPATFFDRAGVGLSDGSDFGMPGYVRLNFGCRRALLLEALARIRRAVGNQ